MSDVDDMIEDDYDPNELVNIGLKQKKFYRIRKKYPSL